MTIIRHLGYAKVTPGKKLIVLFDHRRRPELLAWATGFLVGFALLLYALLRSVWP